MRNKIITSICLSLAAIVMTTSSAWSANRFEIKDGRFMLDGQPYVIKAAELHYPRIPKPYWEHRIQMCKALGMNTICLYVFWNAHESAPGEFDFTGQNDLRHFVELCRDNGMNVILRPGPYVCAEWEMGGLPWWLLQKEDIGLRENDPYFLDRVDKFQHKVAEQVGDLTSDKGGPILMIQVENEYGSYATDKEYMTNIRNIVKKNFGDDVILFQCDWSSNFLNNGLDDLVWTLNFGTGADIDAQFAPLKAARPDSPLMCSEFWSGWFDKWGASHESRPADEMVAGIDTMLSKDISFSLYMTHGGTNWGHWAGANSPGFAPDVTSYDYDAPINEQGAPTPKYHLLRETLRRHSAETAAYPIPEPVDTMSIPAFSLTEYAPLRQNLPQVRKDSVIRSMESYGQGFGSILYRTLLPEKVSAGDTLNLAGVHDYGQVFINGNLIATIDRRHDDNASIILSEAAPGDTLDILIEAMGRINFGRAITDRKGLTGEVTVTKQNEAHSPIRIEGWDIYNLVDDYDFYANMKFRNVEEAQRDSGKRMPRGVYRGVFNLSHTADTFLNFENWGKGLVYVNGHPMGRIWNIGPQQTLYMPGCWLKEGDNEILIFDIIGPQELTVEGLGTPILDKLAINPSKDEGIEYSFYLFESIPLAEVEFAGGNKWEEVRFKPSEPVRYVCLEAIEGIDKGNEAAIAELYLLDAAGQRIPRENWKALYANSSATESGNHTPDKIFDLQESTYWQAAPDASYPYQIVIDLGAPHELGGLQYLPRMETNAPGAIKNLRIFGSISDFNKN